MLLTDLAGQAAEKGSFDDDALPRGLCRRSDIRVAMIRVEEQKIKAFAAELTRSPSILRGVGSADILSRIGGEWVAHRCKSRCACWSRGN